MTPLLNIFMLLKIVKQRQIKTVSLLSLIIIMMEVILAVIILLMILIALILSLLQMECLFMFKIMLIIASLMAPELRQIIAPAELVI